MLFLFSIVLRVLIKGDDDDDDDIYKKDQFVR